jgi:hypothetical protein
MDNTEGAMKLLALAVLVMLAGIANAQTNDIAVLFSNISSSVNWQMATNGFVNATHTNAFCTNWCDRIPTSDHEQAVRDLAAGGVICRVLGHSWRDGRPGEGNGFMFADLHPGTTFRTCKICGWCESKTEESWR